eukprot:4296190-Prorocentrum_lima.AAC.1
MGRFQEVHAPHSHVWSLSRHGPSRHGPSSGWSFRDAYSAIKASVVMKYSAIAGLPFPTTLGAGRLRL